jgi:hypothetical protein
MTSGKDIPDKDVLQAVRELGAPNPSKWASLWDIQAKLASYPPKVVKAKLARLIKRGVLRGCAYGCRGDFHEPEVNDNP